MKFYIVVRGVLFVFLLLGAQARPAIAQAMPQQQDASSKTPGVVATKIDPSKEADIRLLLDIVGTKALVAQTMGPWKKP